MSEELITIRAMTEEDYEGVRALWMTIRGFGIRAVDDSRENVIRFIKRNRGISCVAEKNQKIIGAVLCGHDGRTGYFYHVCVAETERRQGIGEQMVIYCREALGAAGIGKVSLIAFRDNAAGNAFWQKLGWISRGDVNCYDYILNEDNVTHFIH